jgi:hypothetical protein
MLALVINAQDPQLRALLLFNSHTLYVLYPVILVFALKFLG